MRIDISERLKPFSHKSGTYFLLPGTTIRTQIFPAFLRFHDLSRSEPQLIAEVPLKVQGPVEKFTVQQDLEHGEIVVWGQTQNGFFRYLISATRGFVIEKSPENTFFLAELPSFEKLILAPTERLSLGSHKKQEWQLMERRCDLAEILPIWFRLGQWTPKVEKTNEGTAFLLNQIHNATHAEKASTLLHTLFLVGMDCGLSPRLEDTTFQGVDIPSINGGSPLQLLREGSECIRDLFLQSEDAQINVLPLLPLAFHAGRMINAQCGSLGIVHFEWSKKVIRRLIFTAGQTTSVQFSFSGKLRQCRVRSSSAGDSVLQLGQLLNVMQGQTYYLDRFEK